MASALSERSSALAEPVGLYFHVPFCDVKCAYCHFAIDPGPRREDRHARYESALSQELAMRLAEPMIVDTVYWGGGTPSLFAVERIERLLSQVRDRATLAHDAEITLEANPGDLDEAGYESRLKIGVNRISLGVQSFDDRVLAEMGRLHTSADAEHAVLAAEHAGFKRISLDLILGWPGESPERWRDNLRRLDQLPIDHVSLYVLEVEEKTAVSHQQTLGSFRLPDDDLVADLYIETVATLAEMGFERYEISNFARRGAESRHNSKYWADAPFLGFGMAAHSYMGTVRSWNEERFALYCAQMERGISPCAGIRALTPEERRAEALFTGLRRRQGINLKDFRERYGSDPLTEYQSQLAPAWTVGWIEETEDNFLRLTETGVLVSNEVFLAFV